MLSADMQFGILGLVMLFEFLNAALAALMLDQTMSYDLSGPGEEREDLKKRVAYASEVSTASKHFYLILSTATSV